MTVDEWNDLPEEDREDKLSAQVELMKTEEASKQDKPEDTSSADKKPEDINNGDTTVYIDSKGDVDKMTVMKTPALGPTKLKPVKVIVKKSQGKCCSCYSEVYDKVCSGCAKEYK